MVKKVLKFSATWCGPCRVYHKTFENVSKIDKYKDLEFKELDADENEDDFEKYKIMSVPTTILLNEKDEVISSLSGNIPQQALTNFIDSNN
jgi:thioredoxin 1